jgi:hypothetical protein
VEAAVFLDPPERGADVVGVTNEEAARVLGERRKAALRVEREEVFRALHGLGVRTVCRVVTERDLPQPIIRRLLELLAGVVERARGPKPVGVHGVDTDVRSVRRFDEGLELRAHRGRGRQPFREEHQRLASADIRHRHQHGLERRGHRVAAVVAVERLEGVEHPLLALDHLLLHLDLADGGARVGERLAAAT